MGASLLPKDSEELTKLAKMELKHKRGFIACGKNLSVEADMIFAKEFFSKLHGNFQTALEKQNLTTCLLIQAILIEAFAISAYHVYIRAADPFARKNKEKNRDKNKKKKEMRLGRKEERRGRDRKK